MTGDRYLICSDGLSGVVSDETIAATLREYSDPNQCAERLIQLALRGGGPDNITVIIADVTDADILEEEPVVGGAAANDRGMVSSADASTPAARASALTQPREAAPAGPDAGRTPTAGPKRHPIRTTLILVVLAGLLGGGLWFGWRYTQSKYYVGVTDDGTVAVFQGIPGRDRRVRSVHSRLSERHEDRRSDAGGPEQGPGGHPGRRPGRGPQRSWTRCWTRTSKNVLPFCPTADTRLRRPRPTYADAVATGGRPTPGTGDRRPTPTVGSDARLDLADRPARLPPGRPLIVSAAMTTRTTARRLT